MTTGVNLEFLKAKLQELQTGQRADPDFLSKFVKLEEGETSVRILPAAEGEENFFTETGLHRINRKNIHCPQYVENKPCPICFYIRKLWDSGSEENIALARKIKRRKRYYFNVIVREEKGPGGTVEKNVGPKVLSVGVKLFEKILSVFFDPDYGDLTDLESGWDFKIKMEIKDEYPNYDKSNPRPRPSKAGSKQEIEEWMKNLHDLKSLITLKSLEEIKEEMSIMLNEESADDFFDSKAKAAQAGVVEPQAAATAIGNDASDDDDSGDESESESINVDDTQKDFLTQLEKIKAGK